MPPILVLALNKRTGMTLKMRRTRMTPRLPKRAAASGTRSRPAKGQLSPTTTERRAELLRRSGADPLRFDKRPLKAIMKDEIPYARWERERETIRRMGYRGWQHLLK